MDIFIKQFYLLVFSGTLTIGYDYFDIYPTHTFYVEEGILHHPRIIGNITLEKWNASNYFRADESYFEGPNNRKSKAKPQHFEMKFIQSVVDSDYTTASIRKFKRSLNPIDSTASTSTLHLNKPMTAVQLGSSGDYEPSTNPTKLETASNAANFESSSSSDLAGKITITGRNGITRSSSNESVRDNTTTRGNYTKVTSQPKSSAPMMMTTTITTQSNRNASEMETTVATISSTTKRTLQTTASPLQPWSPSLQSDDTFVGELWQIYDLDREQSNVHYMTVNTYSDNEIADIPVLIVVKVTDINDNSPVFVSDSLKSEITKETKMGEIVARVQATDADIGQNAAIHYSLLSFSERQNRENASPDFPSFAIHEKHGVVFLMRQLDDMDIPSTITFSVVAKDNDGKIPCNRATATVTISIVDGKTESTTPSSSDNNNHNSTVGTAPNVEPKSSSGFTTTATPPRVVSKSKSVSLSVIIPVSVVGALVLIAAAAFFIVRRYKKRQVRGDGTLAFMLDDDSPIQA